MHPWDRLHRAFVGERFSEPRGLAKKLFARDVEPHAIRTILSDLVDKPIVPITTIKKASILAHPRPNAPLLKRVVRHPFALETTRGQRYLNRDAVPWADLQRDDIPGIRDIMQTARGEAGPKFPSPILLGWAARSLDRPRPSSDGWLKPGGGASQ